MSLGLRGLPLNLRVNSYVLEVPDGLYLIDCGPFDLYYQLRALTAQKFPTKKILRVYLTHGHSDHAGAGLRCISEGIEVWSASGDKDMLDNGGPPGVPKTFRYPAFQPTNHIDEGHRIMLSETRQLVAFLTPGHTPGSVCFYDSRNDTLLYGDLLFGPLRGYAMTFLLEFLTALRESKAELRQQMESLTHLERRLAEQGNTLMLPGHGPPYYSDAQPGTFDRSTGILKWVLRLKR